MKALFQIFRDGDAGGAPGGGAAPAGGAAAAAPAAAPANLAAAADAAAAAAGGAQNGADAPDGASSQQPPVNGAYYPEGLPDQYRGMTEKETIDKLYADIQGRPKPPATPKDYTFELSPDMKEKFGDLKDDKVLPLWAEVAHELGLDDKAATAAFEKLYQRMEKAGLIDHGPDYTAEIEKLKPARGDPRERTMAVKNRLVAADSFIKGLETRGALSKASAAILGANVDTAAGVIMIEELAAAMGGPGIVTTGGVGAEAYSRTDYERDLNDPRYSTTSPQHDPAFRKAVDEKAQRLPRRKIMEDGRVA